MFLESPESIVIDVARRGRASPGTAKKTKRSRLREKLQKLILTKKWSGGSGNSHGVARKGPGKLRVEDAKARSVESPKKIGEKAPRALPKKQLNIDLERSAKLFLVMNMFLTPKKTKQIPPTQIRHQTTLQRGLEETTRENFFLNVPTNGATKQTPLPDSPDKARKGGWGQRRFSSPRELVCFRGIRFVFEGILPEEEVETHKKVFQTRERTYLDMLRASIQKKAQRRYHKEKLELTPAQAANLPSDPFALRYAGERSFGRFSLR